MSVYRRGGVWWYKFYFDGHLIRESAKTELKTLAKEAEKTRKRELEEGYCGIKRNGRSKRVQLLSEATRRYEDDYKVRHPRSYTRFVRYCIRHLGNKMLIDIDEEAILQYQAVRVKEGASGKTVNDEVGVQFRVIGDVGDVVRLRLQKRKQLRLEERSNVGRALTPDQEKKLLIEARRSRSTSIFPAVILALNAGLRDAEIRHLTWKQVDFYKQILTVGRSRTKAGEGRTIPLNSELIRVLIEYREWYEREVGKPAPGHYVFPHRRGCWNPTRPMVTWGSAWDRIRVKAGVNVRFHDLRHTAITKLAESGAGDETIMAIAGHVSRAMLSRYSHIRTEAKKRHLEAIKTESVPLAAVINQDDPTATIH